MRIGWAAASDTGRIRRVNEDSFLGRPDLGLFAVADGMGGHAAGDIASRLAISGIEEFMAGTAGTGADQTWPYPLDPALSLEANRLRMAFLSANQRIAAASQHENRIKGMATTASAMLVAGETAICAHIGDSRIYRLRDNAFERVTHDHSWVEDQVRAGILSASEARRHPWRNVVTRALSGADSPEVDVIPRDLNPGDRFLLCSDGLSGVVLEDKLAAILGGRDLHEVCRSLVAAANDAGGPDNITAVVIAVDRGTSSVC